MSSLDVLRQIKQARRSKGPKKVVEWGNAEFINDIGVENLSRRELRNHLEARDLETSGTRLELIERLRVSLADEQLHKFAYTETIDTEFLILADMEERGTVYVVGINNKGQLGVGDTEERRTFTAIPQLRGVNTCFVSAGDDMCFAITEDHDVYVWGGGGVGRNGLNPKLSKTGALMQINFLEPAIVHDLAGEEISEVAIGQSHCIACATGGDCFVWGDGLAGQLGLGDFNNRKTIAINNSFPAVRAVSSGANHCVVLTQTQQVYAWGHAANGRLGIGASERIGVPDNERYFFHVPSILPSLEPINKISCGTDHTLAIGASGVWSWGSNAGGRLGLGDQKDRFDPCLVPRLKGKAISCVSAGSWYSTAIVIHPPMFGGGMVYTWGSGYHGQLGQGTKTISLYPEPVEYFISLHLLLSQVSAGVFHCAAVTTDGELYTWGSNRGGCLGRTIDEKDVIYTPVPGHCGGFGAIVGRIGRGLVRHVACGREFTVVCTWPYQGPDMDVAAKLMEEAKIRAMEEMMQSQVESSDNENNL